MNRHNTATSMVRCPVSRTIRTNFWLARLSLFALAICSAELRSQDLPVVVGNHNAALATTVSQSVRWIGKIQAEETNSVGPKVVEGSFNHSQWVLFQPPAPGRLAVEIPSFTPGILSLYLTVFEVSRPERTLQLIAGAIPCISSNRPGIVLSFPTKPEKDYLLGVDAFDTAFTNKTPPTTELLFDFALLHDGSPANDDFEHPEVLVGSSLKVRADLRGAGPQTGEPPLATSNGTFLANGSTVWYSWTAPKTGWLQINPNAPDIYLPITSWTNYPVWTDRLSLITAGAWLNEYYWLPPGYSGNGSGVYGSSFVSTSVDGFASIFRPADCNEFNPAFGIADQDRLESISWIATGAELRLPVTGGRTYRLMVDCTARSRGIAEFNVEFTPRPANDDFEGRISLTGSAVTAQGNTVVATLASDEPKPSQTTNDPPIVWWSWTALAEGPVSIHATSSNHNVRVSVWTGTTLERLGRIVEPPTSGAANQVFFYAVPGTTYQIAIGTLNAPLPIGQPVFPQQASYIFELKQLPARLRPVTAGNGGLIVSDTRAENIIVQEGLPTGWYASALLETAREIPGPGSASAIFIPWPTATNFLSSGSFRVWLLDLPQLPAPNVIRIVETFRDSGKFEVQIDRMLGERAILERSKDLARWDPVGIFEPTASPVLLDTNAPVGSCFYRTQAIRTSALRLTIKP